MHDAQRNNNGRPARGPGYNNAPGAANGGRAKQVNLREVIAGGGQKPPGRGPHQGGVIHNPERTGRREKTASPPPQEMTYVEQLDQGISQPIVMQRTVVKIE